MPQDFPENEETEPTIQRAGGTDTSADADNAGAELEAGSGAPEMTDEEYREMLEEDKRAAEEEISELEEALQNETDPVARDQLQDDLYHSMADRDMATAEMAAFDESGFLGSFEDWAENQTTLFGSSRLHKSFSEMSGLERFQTINYSPALHPSWAQQYINEAAGIYDFFEPQTPLDLVPVGRMAGGMGNLVRRGAQI